MWINHSDLVLGGDKCEIKSIVPFHVDIIEMKEINDVRITSHFYYINSPCFLRCHDYVSISPEVILIDLSCFIQVVIASCYIFIEKQATW